MRFTILLVSISLVFSLFGMGHASQTAIFRRGNDLPTLHQRSARECAIDSQGKDIDAAAWAAGADANWYRSVLTQIEREEYNASPNALGLQAPNRAQNLRTYFRPGSIEVVPRDPASPTWRFVWQTESWGRSGRLQSLQRIVEPTAQGPRVMYEHPGLTEWYENGKDGLEQGFTLATRPEGHGPLRIEGRLGGTVRAELSDDGALDLIDSQGARVLRYGELHVWDADGVEVPSHLSLAGMVLSILIEDDQAAYPLTVDPLMTAPAWTAESDQANAKFGVSVASAGDVNNDGYSDVIVGAYMYDNGQTDEGRAYVYHGTASGLGFSAAWITEGDQANAQLGISVASAGDVNGDGYSEVIVGAWLYANGQTDEGRAYVYHGAAGGLGLTAAWTGEGDLAGARFGVSVASAGDVNSDGYSDVIVGAAYYANGQTDEGRAFLYHGTASGLGASAAWTDEGDQAGALYGYPVASAGDVNGDGYSDVIVGAHRYENGETDEGRAYVYHGAASGLSLDAAWTTEGNQVLAKYAFKVAGAGDVNGDGYSDVIVGAYLYDNGQTDEGRAYVYHGGAGGLGLSAAWTAESDQAFGYMGWSAGTAGDVNGDGYSDVIVGANGYDNGESGEGRAFVYHGAASGLPIVASWTAEIDQVNAVFGYSVASAGDVNGDGYSDVIIGAWEYDNGQSGEGGAFVYQGAASGLALSAAWTAESDQAFTEFGEIVASAGDVNGDGYSDVIVGARLYDNGQIDEGRAFVYCGAASGLALTPSWSAESDQADAWFGGSVASAGDVNGDGYSDVIVGAIQYDSGQADEGRAYVYHGTASGLRVSVAWLMEGDQTDAWLGGSVASAGDVNGDGYSDVIVGASGFERGRAYVYHGASSGLATVAAWTAESDQAFSRFGRRVATAGDVNGDGYSDVIVGAHLYDDGQTDEGRAYVYHGAAGGLGPSAWTAESNEYYGHLGYSVGSAGDVNGDGYSDVIVGAPGMQNDGRAFAYHGGPSGLGTADWSAGGGPSGLYFGSSVAGAGDVNGDGYSDVIVGDHAYSNGEFNEGRASVYHGAATGLRFTAGWTAESNQVGCFFGSSVANAGDVNGDGYSDVIVGADGYDNVETNQGRVFLYYGNGADGLDRIPRQARTDDLAPIAPLCLSNSNDAFRLKALGRTPAGRGRVQLQYEVKPFGSPFDGTGLVTGPASDTGVPGSEGSRVVLAELSTGLAANTLYHWRVRILTDSPAAPRSPWLSLAANAVSEADLRTASGSSEVPPGPDNVAQLSVDPAAPNPFDSVVTLRYALPASGLVRLAVYDAIGREVAVVADEVEDAGWHTARWDGRDTRGNRAAAGVYLVRLEFAGEVEVQKLVRRE